MGSKRGMPAAVVARQLNHHGKRLDLDPDIHQTDRVRAQHGGPWQKTGPRCNGRGLIKPTPGQ